jgi:hypothetical protein
MDLNPSSRPDQRDGYDWSPWQAPPAPDQAGWPSDSWVDPLEERALLRRSLRRFRLGFAILGLALIVASLSTIGNLILFFARQRQPIGLQFGIPNWRLIEGAIITWGSLLGVFLLCGRWPDIHWQRRSGILLLMCLVDAALWTLQHAVELGLSDGAVGHEWFRDSLGTALGWSEFALIASLAADVASHLGQPQSIDFAKAVRSLATTGAMVWFMYFYFLTNWRPPLWPLQAHPHNPGTFMLLLAWLVLAAINLVQVTGLSLLAGRCCARALREMDKDDRANDMPPSRSEAGWDEFTRPPSGPKGGA